MKITIDENLFEISTRLDQFLSDYFDQYSRNKLSHAIKDNYILVNNSSVKPSYLIKLGDNIEIDLEYFKVKEVEAQNIALDIIYQDQFIAIINKPINMIVHPTIAIRKNTLVNALKFHFTNLSKLGGEDRAGIIHRLDRNTSGLMIVALDDEAYLGLNKAFKERSVVKKYRAICRGAFTQKNFIIENYIGRNHNNRKLMAVTDSDKGKYAKTGVHVCDFNKGYSLVDLTLYTGRTHQIRVHLSNINHPILGDHDYGGKDGKLNINHQLLESYYISFNHPITGEKLEFTIDESCEFNKYKKILFGA